MTQDKIVVSLKALRYWIAVLIALGGIMHLIGFINILLRDLNPPLICWVFYLVAILIYPTFAVMILKDIRWVYFLTAGLPSVGGIAIFIGFLFPDSRLLMLMAGTIKNEITWYGFIQIVSESMAVAFSGLLLYHRIWKRDKDIPF
jgi:hypothetical protein